MKKYVAVMAMVALVSILLPGCNAYGSPPTSTTASASPVATNTVSLVGFAFSPPAITVKAGTAVTWTNKDATDHIITADDKTVEGIPLFDSGALSKDATFSHTFAKAGTFAYHCSVHPYMKGTVVVQ